MKIRLLVLAVAGATATGTAFAAPFAPFDVRSAGMGGTGVASAKAASAALFNPAMLSAQLEGDKFQFVLGAGANVADNDDMYDQVDAIKTTIDNLDTAIGTIQSLLPTQRQTGVLVPGVSDASVASGALASQLASISGDKLIAGLGAGTGLGVPGNKLGVGVLITMNAQLAASPSVSGFDRQTLLDFAGVTADGVVTVPEALSSGISRFITLGGPGSVPGELQFDQEDYLTGSTANGTAIALGEIGVSFSHRFDLSSGGMLSVGVTPKLLQASTFDYTSTVDNFDDADIDSGTYETTDEGFDMDVGLIYRPSMTSAWQFGLVAKNVAGNEFKTATQTITLDEDGDGIDDTIVTGGKIIEVATQVRAGVARTTERTTITVDLDLAENDGVIVGQGTQFLALGAEYDLRFLQLRAGYRANLADSVVEDVASLGVGLGPVDLSVIGNGTDIGASLQFGFGW